MIITYHGADFFKVQFGDTIIAINPVAKDSALKSSRFGADIALISTQDLEHNGADAVSRTDKEPFIISGPGEYEVSGIFIKGFLSKTYYGNTGGTEGNAKINTIYTVTLEGMKLCFLGALGTSGATASVGDALPSEAKESMEDVDILFVPIGGDGVLDAHAAEKIAVQCEPRVIIPSHFPEGNGSVGLGSKDALKTFLKEAGAESVKPVDKLTIKKKDIEAMEGEVVVLASVA